MGRARASSRRSRARWRGEEGEEEEGSTRSSGVAGDGRMSSRCSTSRRRLGSSRIDPRILHRTSSSSGTRVKGIDQGGKGEVRGTRDGDQYQTWQGWIRKKT